MKIEFLINSEFITSMDVIAAPFQVGDEVQLEVVEFSQGELSQWRETHQANLVEENKNILPFNKKRVKILIEEKSLTFKEGKDAKVSIKYFCEVI